MKPFVTSFVAVLFLTFPLAAQNPADDKPKEGAQAPAPPQAVYQHTTAAGRLGKFELDGKQGKADYYFNGQRHQDDLVFVRSAQMSDSSLPSSTPGWVYQVSSKGKKESVWFFFAANPIVRGSDVYAMSYSTTPPNADGKQPWWRIFTPAGTKRTPLERKEKGSEKEK